MIRCSLHNRLSAHWLYLHTNTDLDHPQYILLRCVVDPSIVVYVVGYYPRRSFFLPGTSNPRGQSDVVWMAEEWRACSHALHGRQMDISLRRRRRYLLGVYFQGARSPSMQIVMRRGAHSSSCRVILRMRKVNCI